MDPSLLCPIEKCNDVFTSHKDRHKHVTLVQANDLFLCGSCGNGYANEPNIMRHTNEGLKLMMDPSDKCALPVELDEFISTFDDKRELSELYDHAFSFNTGSLVLWIPG
ncbi:predicted protein [Lichtheimia corymbifera JMRC:FSU:9682]|uniref:C2H2-type domain-containing protein n=1 Tax=Lichtheimia corymbifera JMRC:FSU:9682 TaxID=1263082 RepID=A0A068RJT6_9FUNG|nr:predicted protein [Lichtheimia corymbifera JMRC:FSU:9682]